VRGRERPSWEAAVVNEEANGAVGLGRKRAEGEAPLRTELGGANGGGGGSRAHARRSGALL
jgi:hypothetical protein